MILFFIPDYSYTYEFKSNELFHEIKIALDAFADPLTQITKDIVGKLPTQTGKAALLQMFSLMEEAMSIFYSLNYQGIGHFPQWERQTVVLTSPRV